MEISVELLSCLKYEKEGKKGTRLGYRMLGKEYLQDAKNMKGYSELSEFFEGHETFDRIPVSFFGDLVHATIKEIPNPRNPLKKRSIIASLECNGNVVDLL